MGPLPALLRRRALPPAIRSATNPDFADTSEPWRAVAAERGARFDEAKKYPLCVVVHGGPQGSTGDDWHYRWNLQCLASAGFAVLAPNFRGSTGFGHAYCRDLCGNQNFT